MASIWSQNGSKSCAGRIEDEKVKIKLAWRRQPSREGPRGSPNRSFFDRESRPLPRAPFFTIFSDKQKQVPTSTENGCQMKVPFRTELSQTSKKITWHPNGSTRQSQGLPGSKCDYCLTFFCSNIYRTLTEKRTTFLTGLVYTQKYKKVFLKETKRPCGSVHP